MRRKKILPFATTLQRTNIESIMLNESSQTERDEFCICISHVYHAYVESKKARFIETQ